MNNHYRRFQSADHFRAKLHEAGFDCRYFVEGIGYATFGTEDPWVGRFVVAKK